MTWRLALVACLLLTLVAAIDFQTQPASVLADISRIAFQASKVEGDGETVLLAGRAMPAQLTAVEGVESFERGRIYTGVIKASRTSDVGFERTGRLLQVLAAEGDHVAEDQILARLDTRNLDAKKRELEARRDAAQATLDELLAGPRDETIAAAKAAVQDLQAQLELAELRFRRSATLVEKKAISKDEFDERSIGRRSIEARLQMAKQQLAELENGTREEQLAAQRAIVEQLNAGLENVAVDLEDSALRAPFEGVIAFRYLDEGAIVAPNAPVLRIIESNKLEAWIGVPAATAQRLDRSREYTIQVGDQETKARVHSVLPEVDPATRTRTVIFTLDACDAAPAQVARVEIGERVEAKGFWVPATALTRGNRGLWSVLVAEETGGELIAARRLVEVLYNEGDRALVRGTIMKDERVLTEGASLREEARLPAGRSQGGPRETRRLLEGDRLLTGGAHRYVEGQTIEVITE